MTIAPPDVLQPRGAALRRALGARGLDALIVTSLPNIAYLTGFFASAGALVATPDALVLIGDGRYRDALADRAQACDFLRIVELLPGASYDETIADVVAELAGLRVGIEADHLTVSRHRYLTRAMEQRGSRVALIESDGVVEELRVVKDAWEIGRLRDAGARLSEAAKCILPKVLEGRSESEVAADVDAELRRVGFDRPAFDTIVAAGPRAALPHARAGRRRLETGDLVVIDCGGVLDGYCSDLTRTVVIGGPSDRQRRLVEQIVEAQEAAFRAVRAGASPESVDAAARDLLGRHGIAEAFTHGTGHGLGLELHEAPRVTRARGQYPEPPLAAGMVMTLEPGAYFAGWGGVRIEDDVLVTADGAEWLTDVPRNP